jgi:aconitate decarboxylase
MTSLTQSLANYVANPSFGGGEKDAYAIAKLGFVDTVGTMIAGTAEPVVKIMLAHYAAFEEPRQAPVPFAGVFKPVAQAACINATAGHALDYDDVAMSGHPSTVLVPAILAEGHRLGVSGQAALQAYVVGYEVWAELVWREPGKYHLKGWHPTGVLGTVAVAAAIARLHQLDPQQCAAALAIAASMASGLVANFGTMTKPFHAGRAAANGIEAVQLAKLGLTAAPDVFEHNAGYLNALSISGNADRASPATRLGQKPRLLQTGLSIKRYPVCYSCHRTIDGMLQLIEQADLKASDVKHVSATIGKAQASMLRNHRPQTGLEAKFSIEFAIASALVDREVGLKQLTDTFVQRPDVQAQFAKVSTKINEEPCPLEPSFSLHDRVVVELTDGRVLDSGDIRFPLGNAGNPMDEAGMRVKFFDCIAAGLADGAQLQVSAPDLYARLSGLENLSSVATIFHENT